MLITYNDEIRIVLDLPDSLSLGIILLHLDNFKNITLPTSQARLETVQNAISV